MIRVATLKNARKVDDPYGTFLVGEIYGDSDGRYPDGIRIFTSRITREISPNIFDCLSGTTFLVESWAR